MQYRQKEDSYDGSESERPAHDKINHWRTYFENKEWYPE